MRGALHPAAALRSRCLALREQVSKDQDVLFLADTYSVLPTNYELEALGCVNDLQLLVFQEWLSSSR